MTTIAHVIRDVFVGDVSPPPTMPPVVVATPAAFALLNLIALVMA